MKIIENVRYSVEAIDAIIEAHVLPHISNVRAILFWGTLGAGKTTFIKHLIRLLGSHEIVTSPTFNYVNVYQGKNVSIHHFDLYRLGSWNEAEELGLHEQIGLPNSIALIEWPEIARSFFEVQSRKYDVLEVCISYDAQNLAVRSMVIKKQ